MDGFCDKVSKLIEQEKFQDIINSFKSKTKSITADEIQYYYRASIDHNIPILSMLFLKYRLNTIRMLPDNQWITWIDHVSLFLSTGSVQIPPVLHKKLFSVAVKYGEICAELGKNDRSLLKKALKVLLSLIELTRDQNEITPVHYLVCRLALQSKKLFEVESLIENDYMVVSRETGVKGDQCVLFFYYIGSVALILKKTSKAYSFYEKAIAVPCKAIHSASIESFKKLVLLRLIIDGSEYQVGRNANPKFNAVTRGKSVEPYTQLASLVSECSKNRSSFEDVTVYISRQSSVWASDQNLGLIKKLVLALVKQKINKLTKVYASISFSQLVEETKVDSAEAILTSMVENNEIQAKIDKKLKLVIFEDRDDETKLDEIEDVCKRLMSTSCYLERAFENVILDKRYLKDLLAHENMKKN